MEVARALVMLGVVVAVVAYGGYLMVNHVDHELTFMLIGSLTTAFGLIIKELFSANGNGQ